MRLKMATAVDGSIISDVEQEGCVEKNDDGR